MEGKTFSNTATYQKLKGRFHQHHHAPPLCKGGGMSLRVRQRVKIKWRRKNKISRSDFQKPILKKLQPQSVASGGILSPHLLTRHQARWCLYVLLCFKLLILQWKLATIVVDLFQQSRLVLLLPDHNLFFPQNRPFNPRTNMQIHSPTVVQGRWEVGWI